MEEAIAGVATFNAAQNARAVFMRQKDGDARWD
jgi:hypothetical protein